MSDKYIRDPEKVIETIRRIHALFPDLRMGELICNAVPHRELYYMENETLIKDLERFYRAFDDRLTDSQRKED